ncbi:Rv0361 family membrane protein [Nocardia sp. R16R-3T]
MAGGASGSTAETVVIKRDSGAAKAAAPAEDSAEVDAGAGADAATMVMRRVDPKAESTGGKGSTVAAKQPDETDLAGADDKTVAMPVVSKLDAEQTVALPIQRPVDKDATHRMRTDAGTKPGTDRVVPPAARPGPLTKPPSTPRPAAGPKQAGAQGPSPSGPAVEETAPSAPRGPGRPRQVASAPSPADSQKTRPAQSVTGSPQSMAQPQRYTPPPQQPEAAEAPARPSKRWLLLGAAAAALVAVIGLAVVLVGNRGDNSPEAKVRATITDYTQALKSGDLAALRNTTCGQLHDFYQGIPADQFASVHQLSTDRKNIPVVASVDTIKITDKKAIAQATVYTDTDPTKRSARTFDLEQTADGWKVCDPPSAGKS